MTSAAERIIRNEHRNLAGVLVCMREMARALPDAGPVADAAVFRQGFDYVEQFLNAFHHPKEDKHLFAALRRRCPDLADKLDVLEEQHKTLPQQLADVRAALARCEQDPAGGCAAFRDAVEAYCQIEFDHMGYEEAEILPSAGARLTQEDWQEIDAAFLDNQDPVFGETRKSEFRTLFKALVNQAPAPFGLGPAHD